MRLSTAKIEQFPIPLEEIARVVRDTRASEPDKLRPDKVSNLLEKVTTACARAEMVAQTLAADSGAQYRDIGRELDDLKVPGLSNWTSASGAVATLSPAVLRTGAYHDECEVPASTGMMLGMVSWRYLAARLALHRAGRPLRPYVAYNLEETRQALLHAARIQRKVLKLILFPDFPIVGDLIALSLVPFDVGPTDSYLVKVNELSGCGFSGEKLLLRVKAALESRYTQDINHKVVMTDNFNLSNFDHNAYSIGDQLQVIGNPDEVRFVVVVSGVPDPNDEEAFLRTYEGRFELNKERLRGMLLGVPATAPSDERNVAPSESRASNVVPMPSVEMSREQFREASSEHPSETSDAPAEEPLLSRGSAARAFFGYTGLPESNR
jgi:hypothetical protein